MGSIIKNMSKIINGLDISKYVVHCKKSHYDVYCGRGNGSIWGNPFRDGTRDENCDNHMEWLLTQEHLIKKLPELKGKILSCWCSPKRCHCDILAYLANKE